MTKPIVSPNVLNIGLQPGQFEIIKIWIEQHKDVRVQLTSNDLRLCAPDYELPSADPLGKLEETLIPLPPADTYFVEVAFSKGHLKHFQKWIDFQRSEGCLLDFAIASHGITFTAESDGYVETLKEEASQAGTGLAKALAEAAGDALVARAFESPNEGGAEIVELPDDKTFAERVDAVLERPVTDYKLSNPKDRADEAKPNVMPSLEPVALYDGLADLEGITKYGQSNYCEQGSSVQTYLKACERHLIAFTAGQWADSKTQVPHLASARRCLAIILDGFIRQVIQDDRPPPYKIDAVLSDVNKIGENVRRVFADSRPVHYDRRNSRHVIDDPTMPDYLKPKSARQK